MSENSKSDLFLLPEVHNSEIKSGKLYLYLYNELYYNFYCSDKVDTDKLISAIFSQYPEASILLKEEIHKKFAIEKNSTMQKIIIKIREKLLMEIRFGEALIFYSKDISTDTIENIKNIMIQCVEPIKKKNRFGLIVTSQYSDSCLEIEDFDVKEKHINVKENYNDDFLPVSKSITAFLKEKGSSGLVLLHGKQGTGKTTFIRHLINTVGEKFIYLQSQMIDEITKPGFLPFISQYKNSILIIEDCENVIKSRDITFETNSALGNLLNIGDGLLSDALSLKVICTFNTDLKNIDKAILRKGRLKGKYEFAELSEAKVKILFKKLDIKNTEPKPMTLAEIYNISDTLNDTNNNNNVIGFKKFDN